MRFPAIYVPAFVTSPLTLVIGGCGLAIGGVHMAATPADPVKDRPMGKIGTNTQILQNHETTWYTTNTKTWDAISRKDPEVFPSDIKRWDKFIKDLGILQNPLKLSKEEFLQNESDLTKAVFLENGSESQSISPWIGHFQQDESKISYLMLLDWYNAELAINANPESFRKYIDSEPDRFEIERRKKEGDPNPPSLKKVTQSMDFSKSIASQLKDLPSETKRKEAIIYFYPWTKNWLHQLQSENSHNEIVSLHRPRP